MIQDLHQHALFHAAFLVGALALLLRNQMYLRVALFVSIGLSALYHAFGRNGPMWDDLFWNGFTLLTNVIAFVQLTLDRTHLGLSDEEERLFLALGSLSPGEFRKLVRLAEWHTAAEPKVLTQESVRPDSLFYVLSGSVTLDKAGRRSKLPAPMFVGEVAYLKNRGASATVTVEPGSRYVTWSTAALARCFAKRQALRVALMRLLSADLAAKVAIAPA